MSASPMKFMGGLVLEIAAVIAVLSLLPAFGSRDPQATSLSQLQSAIPNQVFFDAQSARVLDLPSRGTLTSPTSALEPQSRPAPPAVFASDYSQPRTAAEQRFVEEMLDNTSQRAMDAAARVLDRGEELLPADLRARRQPIPAASEVPRLNSPSASAPSFGRTPVQNIDRGELIELPSAQRTNDYAANSYPANNYSTGSYPANNYAANNYPASSYRPQPSHPSFAETYQAPPTQVPQSQPLTTGVVHPRFSPQSQQPAASYSPPASHYSAVPAPAQVPAAQVAPSLPERPDFTSRPSYYQRSAGMQMAEPQMRRYDDRY